MFFHKKSKSIIYEEFSARIPKEYTREVAELLDKLQSSSSNNSNVTRWALWSKIYSIFPGLKYGVMASIDSKNAISYTVSVSAADYSESPFNSQPTVAGVN